MGSMRIIFLKSLLITSKATSPYIASQGYCAVDGTLYASGAACGSCWKVSYDAGLLLRNLSRVGIVRRH